GRPARRTRQGRRRTGRAATFRRRPAARARPRARRRGRAGTRTRAGIELGPAQPAMRPPGSSACTLVLREQARSPRWVAIHTLVAIVGVALLLGYFVTQAGVLVLQSGNWTPQLGIVLVADRLTALMLLVSSVVTLAVLVYSSAQTVSENIERT